jgi:hypothetical protein
MDKSKINVDECVNQAVIYGRTGVLEWIHRTYLIPCIVNEETQYLAAGYGHTHVLKWVLKNQGGLHVNEFMESDAAKNNQVQVLHWIRKHFADHDFSARAIEWNAARYGHPNILDFLLGENEYYEVGEDAQFVAARYGQAGVFRWMLSMGMNLHLPSCNVAVERGYLSVLKLFHEYSAQLDIPRYKAVATDKGYNEIVAYLAVV